MDALSTIVEGLIAGGCGIIQGQPSVAETWITSVRVERYVVPALWQMNELTQTSVISHPDLLAVRSSVPQRGQSGFKFGFRNLLLGMLTLGVR